MLAGLAAIGLFASTLTEVPIAAMAVTAITAVVVQILDAVPQISAIHPYLLTDWWLRFGDLLRDPVVYGDMTRGLLVTPPTWPSSVPSPGHVSAPRTSRADARSGARLLRA